MASSRILQHRLCHNHSCCRGICDPYFVDAERATKNDSGHFGSVTPCLDHAPVYGYAFESCCLRYAQWPIVASFAALISFWLDWESVVADVSRALWAAPLPSSRGPGELIFLVPISRQFSRNGRLSSASIERQRPVLSLPKQDLTQQTSHFPMPLQRLFLRLV